MRESTAEVPVIMTLVAKYPSFPGYEVDSEWILRYFEFTFVKHLWGRSCCCGEINIVFASDHVEEVTAGEELNTSVGIFGCQATNKG